jgi:hypothetical protein
MQKTLGNADACAVRAGSGVTNVHTTISTAFAILLVLCASPVAMAQSGALNDDALTASQDAAGQVPLLTEVAWRAPSRSEHLPPRQSRNVGLKTGGDDNYQYWRQACCQ